MAKQRTGEQEQGGDGSDKELAQYEKELAQYEKQLASYLQGRIKPGLSPGAIPLRGRVSKWVVRGLPVVDDEPHQGRVDRRKDRVPGRSGRPRRGRRAAAEVLDSGQPHPYGGSVWPNQALWRPSGVSGPSLELSG